MDTRVGARDSCLEYVSETMMISCDTQEANVQQVTEHSCCVLQHIGEGLVNNYLFQNSWS